MSAPATRPVALVTGGGKGIGAATARLLAAAGYAVAITWFRDEVSAEKTASRLGETGAAVQAFRAHLGDRDAPAKVLAEAERAFGPVTHLVANAATGVLRPLRELRETHWDWVMDTNARSLVRFVQGAPELTSVVAVSSLGARGVLSGYGMVGTSKAALESLVRYLAVELAGQARVNAVSAGVVETESLRRLFPDAGGLAAAAAVSTPAGRLVEADEVARAIRFLLLDGGGITGQTLVVDGGRSLLA